MTKGLVVALLATLAIAGVGRVALAFHDQSVAARLALAQKDSIIGERDRALVVVEEARRSAAAESARLRAQHRRDDSVRAALDSALKAAGARLDEALRAVVPPEALPLLDSLEQSFEQRLAMKDSTIGALRLDLRNALRDQASCDDAATNLRRLADDYKAQAEAWRRRAEPGFWSKLKSGVGWALGGAAFTATVAFVAGAGG